MATAGHPRPRPARAPPRLHLGATRLRLRLDGATHTRLRQPDVGNTIPAPSPTSSDNPPRRQTLTDLRRQKSVTYVVCSSVGLDVGSESSPYGAGWGEDGALDAIREYAHTIDTIARRIEDALDPKPEPTSDAVEPEALAA